MQSLRQSKIYMFICLYWKDCLSPNFFTVLMYIFIEVSDYSYIDDDCRPWSRNTRSAYSSCEQDSNRLLTWSVAVSRSLMITPSATKLVTLSVTLNRLMSSQQFICGVARSLYRRSRHIVVAEDYSCTKGYLAASDFDCHLRSLLIDSLYSIVINYVDCRYWQETQLSLRDRAARACQLKSGKVLHKCRRLVFEKLWN